MPWHAPILFALAVVFITSCHPRPNSKQKGQSTALSKQDSALAVRFPLPEHLQAQKELLQQYAHRDKHRFKPDGEALEGNFASGTIDLIFDKTDGEPHYLYGHLEEPLPQTPLEFVVLKGISNAQLDALVPGKKYRVHWLESVVNFEPFDDDRYRYFVVWDL